MASTKESTQFDGAISLLRDCVGSKAGERVLIVREPDNYGYYDEKTPRIAAEAGRHLGLKIYETVSDSLITDADGRTKLVDTLAGFDHIVFFSRVGDQLRFSSDIDIPSSTICYTLDSDALNSNFSKACHHGMSEVKEAIDNAFESASEIRVTCPRGTDYIGHPNWTAAAKTDVYLKRFPLLVPRPIPASGFTGKVALCHFLTGTGSRTYEPYTLNLPVNVIAYLDNNRITHFEGDEAAVKQVENHYKTVSEYFDIDPWYVDVQMLWMTLFVGQVLRLATLVYFTFTPVVSFPQVKSAGMYWIQLSSWTVLLSGKTELSCLNASRPLERYSSAILTLLNYSITLVEI
jgi:hypothetical protein